MKAVWRVREKGSEKKLQSGQDGRKMRKGRDEAKMEGKGAGKKHINKLHEFLRALQSLILIPGKVKMQCLPFGFIRNPTILITLFN